MAGLVEAEDAAKRCTWTEDDGTRCDNAPQAGSATKSVCAEHMEALRAQEG